MLSTLTRRMRNEGGFNMIELMVVVVIIGILAAIAVPIYSKYAKNARVTEATGRLGDILTACKSYAIEHETDTDPTTAQWPATCVVTNFVGDCTASENFTYALVGVADGELTITATGKSGGKMDGVTAELTITDPTLNGSIAITGL